MRNQFCAESLGAGTRILCTTFVFIGMNQNNWIDYVLFLFFLLLLLAILS